MCDALVKDVPALDPQLIKLLKDADAAEIEERRAAGPKLWLFEPRDHGTLVAAEGHANKPIQFEIGNPLTAERMTRHCLAAGEYVLPCSLFNQFGAEEVAKMGHELDEELKQVLIVAAG